MEGDHHFKKIVCPQGHFYPPFCGQGHHHGHQGPLEKLYDLYSFILLK